MISTADDIKTRALNLLPPATIAVVIAFWMLAPKVWVNNPLSLIIAGGVTLAFVQALEWVHERHVTWRLTWQEFFTDLFYVILGYTVIDWLSTHLAENPLLAMKAALHISTPWAEHLPFLVQAAVVIVLIEFGQYWMHRLMHNFTPFWMTHAPHHHITQLNAMKGAVGNPIELFLISLSVVALFDFQLPAVFCGVHVLSTVSIYAHANVRSDPPRWYAFFFTTIRNHSLHHSVPLEDTRSNYANSLILIDRVFGTFKDGEGVVVGQDERKRLSIWDQTVFPFMPLVKMIKARRGQSAAV